MPIHILFLALGANFCFALGSQVFTVYSRRLGAVWMNATKALIAGTAFLLWLFFSGRLELPDAQTFWPLFISGAIGLGLGDIFLLRAFKEMGPGRALVLFSFHPLFLGLGAHWFLGQGMEPTRLIAIVFMILCLLTFAHESFQETRKISFTGPLCALVGIILDASGVLITRGVFDTHPGADLMAFNLYRCMGALAPFVLWSLFGRFNFVAPWKKLDRKGIALVIAGSLLGTFISLSLYLGAVRQAHLASLSGLAITGTLFSALFDCLRERRWPSRHLLIALCFFFAGMYVLLK
jgi:drug/metabolite transporter (DMT)-like permease